MKNNETENIEPFANDQEALNFINYHAEKILNAENNNIKQILKYRGKNIWEGNIEDMRSER